MTFYTGVGSREVPSGAIRLGEDLGEALAPSWNLRTGGASGMDQAFLRGVQRHALEALYLVENYIPWNGFEGYVVGEDLGTYLPYYWKNWQDAIAIAKDIHPAWGKLSRGMKALHTRNVYQILGKTLDTPSKFIIYYAKPVGSSVSGGTRTAVELARQYKIPELNLYHPEICTEVERQLNESRLDIVSLFNM